MEGTRVANIEGSLFFPKGSGTNWNIVQIAEGRFGRKPLLLFFQFYFKCPKLWKSGKSKMKSRFGFGFMVDGALERDIRTVAVAGR